MRKRLLHFVRQPRLLPRRLAVDLRSDAICWAESRWTLHGFEVIDCGREEVARGERPQDLLVRLAETCRFRDAEIVVAVRHPELRLERLELPGMPKAEIRGIGARRAAALSEEMPEPANSVFATDAGRAGRVLWLVACPESFAEFAQRQWETLGLDVARLQSVHLSLGSLTRKLAAPKAGELRSFFEIGEGQATCVVADAEGWIFSRDIGFKPSDATHVKDADGHSGSGTGPYERLATELRRTLHYVESELRLGVVSELYVSGDLPDPEGLIASVVEQVPVAAKLLTEALESPTLNGAHPALGIALGLAQASSLEGGNLLGMEAKRERSRASLSSRLQLACAVLGFAVALSGGWLTFSLRSLRAEALRSDEIWAGMDDARRATQASMAARQRAEALGAIAERVDALLPPFRQAIESIGMLLPGDAVLQKLMTWREGERWNAALEVEFRGESMAAAADDAGKFRAALEVSPIWHVLDVSQRRDVPQPLGVESAVRVHFDLDAEIRSSEPLASHPRPRGAEGDGHG